MPRLSSLVKVIRVLVGLAVTATLVAMDSEASRPMLGAVQLLCKSS